MVLSEFRSLEKNDGWPWLTLGVLEVWDVSDSLLSDL